MTSAPKYRVEVRDPELARAGILAFWKRIGFEPFEGTVDPEKRYDWLYLQNPAGRGRTYLLVEAQSDNIVGCVGAIDRLFFDSGRRIRASMLADFLVDPAHRSLYPALLLQREARRCELEKCGMVYGIPAAKALAVFTRLGADSVRASKTFVRAISWRHAMSKYLWAPLATFTGSILDALDMLLDGIWLIAEKFSGRWSVIDHEVINKVWAQNAAVGRLVGERTSTFMDWRFSKHPATKNQLFIVSAAADGQPIGYFVCSTSQSRMVISDYFFPDDAAIFANALRTLISAARKLDVLTLRVDVVTSSAVERHIRATRFSCRSEKTLFVLFGRNWAQPSLEQLQLTHADIDG